MKTLLTLCCLTTGLAMLPQAQAAPTAVALPSVAHMAPVVVVKTGHHRHSRLVKKVYWRHGHRVVVYKRVYY